MQPLSSSAFTRVIKTVFLNSVTSIHAPMEIETVLNSAQLRAVAHWHAFDLVNVPLITSEYNTTCVSERFIEEWSCHSHRKDNDAAVSVGRTMFQKFFQLSVHARWCHSTGEIDHRHRTGGGSSSMSDATAVEDTKDYSATSLMPESKKEEGKGEMDEAV
uniref:Uncharacterized protein n=1 Tax=Oryza meridionalis TaxID=40149 RepID=A0A0E0CCB5_9ORYZ